MSGSDVRASAASPVVAALPTHTPGPWVSIKITYPRGKDVSFEVGAPSPVKRLVAMTVMREIGFEDRWIAEDEANARLIAAAPDGADLARECAAVFRRYEQLHRAKQTNEAYEKAEANARMAERCEAFLAKALGIGSEATTAAPSGHERLSPPSPEVPQ